jgi:hypothetical protein
MCVVSPTPEITIVSDTGSMLQYNASELVKRSEVGEST